MVDRIAHKVGLIVDDDGGIHTIDNEGNLEDLILTGLSASARIEKNGDQTIPNDVDTGIHFDVEKFDTFNVYDDNAFGIFKVPVTGVYMFGGYIRWEDNAIGYRRLQLQVSNDNGGSWNEHCMDSREGIGGGHATESSIFTIDQIISGYWVRLAARQNSGGNLSSIGGNNGFYIAALFTS